MNMKPFCSAPLTGLFLLPDGGIKYCCALSNDIGNINENTIEEIFNNKKHNFLVQKIVNEGKSSEDCQRCIYQETVDPSISQRNVFNTNFYIKNLDKQELKSIDLRWSNQCNLSCRHCNSYFSSEWVKIEGGSLENSNKNYHESILNYIKQHVDTIDEVNLLGGEPFLLKQNLQLLDIIKNNKNIRLSIFTNASVKFKNNAIFDKIKNLKNNINVMLSIDAIEEQFEYIRSGANWKQVLENIEILKNIDNAKLNLAPVYCIWTADSIDRYCEFSEKMKLPLMVQQVGENEYFKKSFYPYGHNDLVRERFIKKLESVNYKEFLPSLTTLKQDSPVEGRSLQFLEKTNVVEKLIPPNKPFNELWPELFRLLNKQ